MPLATRDRLRRRRPSAHEAALAILVLAAAAVAARAQDAPPPAPPAASAPDVSQAPQTPQGQPSDAARECAVRRGLAAAAAGPDALVLVLVPDTADGLPDSNRNADHRYLCPVTARTSALLFGAGRPVPPAGPAVPPAAETTASEPIDRIYLPLRNPAMERWTGPEPAADAATALGAGFREARPLDALADDLALLLRGRTTLYVSCGPAVAGAPALAKLVAKLREKLPGRWVRLGDVPGAGKDDLVESLRHALPARTAGTTAAETLAKLDPVEVRSARAIVGALREVKSLTEIERIRRAVAATVAGHADAMRAARAGLFEHHLAALVEYRCRTGGCRRQAYPSIAGSGPWSCVLHYDRNERELHDGDMVVLDAGGEFEGYACDVTRSFPVNGRFTPEQAFVYDAVLEAQTAAIAAVRPGVTLREVHDVARGVLAKHGLDKWFIHGTCHTVGLDVHDSWRADAVLRAGCVITVEPGVYDTTRQLGVRIEDTILVTETGCEVLSAALPKTRADVERLMAEDLPESMLR